MEHHPTHQKVTGSIPGQGTCLGCGFNPWLGWYGRQPIGASLSHRFFYPWARIKKKESESVINTRLTLLTAIMSGLGSRNSTRGPLPWAGNSRTKGENRAMGGKGQKGNFTLQNKCVLCSLSRLPPTSSNWQPRVLFCPELMAAAGWPAGSQGPVRIRGDTLPTG